MSAILERNLNFKCASCEGDVIFLPVPQSEPRKATPDGHSTQCMYTSVYIQLNSGNSISQRDNLHMFSTFNYFVKCQQCSNSNLHKSCLLSLYPFLLSSKVHYSSLRSGLFCIFRKGGHGNYNSRFQKCQNANLHTGFDYSCVKIHIYTKKTTGESEKKTLDQEWFAKDNFLTILFNFIIMKRIS